jgi:hypothetical protein
MISFISHVLGFSAPGQNAGLTICGVGKSDLILFWLQLVSEKEL